MAANIELDTDEIVYELRQIKRILTVIATKDLKTTSEKVAMLYEMGFRVSEIATMLSLPSAIVRSRIHELQRANLRKKKNTKT